MKPLLLLLPFGLALLMPACGGPTNAQGLIDEAQTALTAREYARAGELASKAVTAARQEGDEALAYRGSTLRVSALARQGKGTDATAALETAATEFPARVDAKLYARTMSELQQAGSIDGALDVLEAGRNRFPDQRAAFDDGAAKLKATLEAGDNPEAIQRLKALGYL